MTSSTTGDQRWGSTKKGGMTVLGKVAVPKPINLPSQRLENHGLDPNVEIVPKGSLSWGTMSSSAGSNVWGSSTALSPRTESGTASPSHLSCRPSSSGGTRPSTAGSETANSRPSSSSGVLPANNMPLAVLRPHSSEMRPGSSHLSRFAENLSEGTATSGASAAAEKLGLAAPSRDGYPLSSGDFPTLGSEKDSGKNAKSLDNSLHDLSGSPGPSFTTRKMEAAPVEDISHPMDAKRSIINSWENDGPCHGMDSWQHGDSYPYPNHNISPPVPYETWQGGPPLNPPGGVWFRPPPGVPYGTPPLAAPGGYPMDAFPYYCPQALVPGHANSQTVAPHGARPGGSHSKNGDLCRPYMEPYIRPGIPVRPCFYPGYYGRPMGFCNPNERDASLMGQPSGPPAFNKYPSQNAMEPTISNAIPFCGRNPEVVESGPLHSRSNVPVKQLKGWDKNNKESHFVNKASASVHPRDKGHASNSSSQGNVWTEDPTKDKQMNDAKSSLHSEQASSCLTQDTTGSTDEATVKSHDNTRCAEFTDVNPAVDNVPSPRDPTLFKKIEGLNAKVRATDRRHDLHKEESEHDGRGRILNSTVSYTLNEPSANAHHERHVPSVILAPVSGGTNISAEKKDFASLSVGSLVTTISRHSSHNLQGKGDHSSKGKLNTQEADGWRKKSATSESRGKVSAVHSERTTSTQRKEQPPAMKHSESNADGEVKDNSKVHMRDSCDSEHTRPSDVTKQRVIQLQKEEEERVTEQKAKAFAKLEELNKRSANQGKETSRQKMDDVPSNAAADGVQKESKVKIELQFGSFQSGEIASVAYGFNSSKTSQGVESNGSSGVTFSQTNQSLQQQDSVLLPKQLKPAMEDAHFTDVAGHKYSSVRENNRQNGAGYKQKHNVHPGRNSISKCIVDVKDKSNTIVAVLKEVNGTDKSRTSPAVLTDFGSKGVSSSTKSNLHADLPTVSSSLLHPKRKHYRAVKNKYSVDESFSVSSASVQKGFDAMEHSSYGNNDVVWAPVKSKANTEVIVENLQKAEVDTAPSNRIDNSVPSSSKSTRAEIERYIPKAAIKGLTQQGNNQLSTSPLTEKSILGDPSIQDQVSSQTIESPKRPVEHRHVEKKTKKAQVHGSWHQHNTTDLNLVPISEGDLSSITGPAKNSKIFEEARQNRKPKERQPSKVVDYHGKQQLQIQKANEDTVVDGWIIYDEPISSGPAILPGVESHGKSTRGKKNPVNGNLDSNRGSANHQTIDYKSHIGVKGEEYFHETRQAEMSKSSKEHRAAQWQPRPQSHGLNQHGNYPRGRQTVTGEGDKIFKREGSKDSYSQIKQQNQYAAEDMVKPQTYSVGGQECKAAPKDTRNSPNESTVRNVEPAPLGHTDGVNIEQHSSSSRNRRDVNSNGRFNRVRDFRGDQSFSSLESRQNYGPGHRENQSQHSQFEYHPLGPNNRHQRGNNLEGQSDNRHIGARFSSRGQGRHSLRGRGGASSWQRVTIPTEAGCE